MKTSDKVIGFIEKSGSTTVEEIVSNINISRQYAHKIVKDLLDKEILSKIGTPPHVYYSIKIANASFSDNHIPYDNEVFLKNNLLLVDALGNKLVGIEAMEYWCTNQNLPFQKTVNEYIETRRKYSQFYNENHLIDGTRKLENTKGIGEVSIDELYYLDFYAIEGFGKTRLGCLMHYAKQGQNKELMQEIVTEIRNRIMLLIDEMKIEAVLYVPPTIKRKTQIMDYLEKGLNLGLPKIKIKKVSNKIIIPQKALSKLFERVANAKNTFEVPAQERYKKILILDDAVGSGATINEIGHKVKFKGIANKIVGLAITGSYKGFEVISEL